mgnify:CR=1 FL=1
MRAIIVAAALALGACQTPCPAVSTGPTNADFRCEDGSVLHVTFINAALLEVERVEGEADDLVRDLLHVAGPLWAGM